MLCLRVHGSTPPLVVDGVWLDGIPLALTSVIDNLDNNAFMRFCRVIKNYIFHYFPGTTYTDA